MDDRRMIGGLQVLNGISYPVAVAIVWLLYPAFKGVNENAVWLLIWFCVGAAGLAILNHRFLAIAKRVREGANLRDVLWHGNWARLKEDPDAYFTAEDYRRFRKNYAAIMIYMAVMMAGLFVVVWVFVIER